MTLILEDEDEPTPAPVRQRVRKATAQPVPVMEFRRDFAPDGPPSREMPYSEEAEQHVIACCLLDGEIIDRCSDEHLTPESFYHPAHNRLFSILRRIRSENIPVSLEVLVQELIKSGELLSIGGFPYLIQVTGRIPTTAHAGYFIEVVREKAIRRNLIKQATGLVDQCYNGTSLEDLLSKSVPSIGEAVGPSQSGERLRQTRYDPTQVIERPDPIFTASGTTICTPGNLTAFYSQAKAGKTAMIGAMMGAAMRAQGIESDTLGFSGSNTDGRAIIHFDTEQSRYDWQQMVKTAQRRARAPAIPPWLCSHLLTGRTAAESRQMLDAALRTYSRQYHGIRAVFLDGVGDLVADVNEPRECNELVAHLHDAAIKHDCAIVCVLHMNAGSENEKGRGHLGSQLERKAESNITMEKKNGVTSYWGIRQRGKMIAKDGAPSFEWSDLAQMHVSTVPAVPEQKGGRPKKYTMDTFLPIFPTDPANSLTRQALFKYAAEITSIKETSFRDLLTDGVEMGLLVRLDRPGLGYVYHRKV